MIISRNYAGAAQRSLWRSMNEQGRGGCAQHRDRARAGGIVLCFDADDLLESDALVLVRDADGRHGLAGLGEAAPDLGQRGPDRVPDLGGVVLDPARPGEVLGQLAVGDVGHPGVLVDHQGADAGRARIDGDDFLGYGGPTLTVRGGIGAMGGASGGPPCGTIVKRPVTCTDVAAPLVDKRVTTVL